jgi:hypothetical protein
MTRCDRFEREALLRLEQGLPLDDHFNTCPDCQNARTFYDRLQRDIASLGPVKGALNWQRGVWNKVLPTQRVASASRWRYTATAAIAAAIVAAIAVPQLLRESITPTIRAEIIEAGGQIQRGEIAPGSPVVLGSRLQFSASTGGAPYAELRVYRNDDQLILQTSHTGRSAAANEVIRATLLLDAVGRYQPVLFVSNDIIPPPSGKRDDDYAAGVNTGGRPVLGAEIVVR